MSKDIILIGGGGHASVLLGILKDLKKAIYGYIDVKQTSLELNYIGNDSYLTPVLNNEYILVNALGSLSIPRKRKDIYLHYKKMGFQFETIIHPRAIVASNVKVLEATQIMAGAILQSGVIVNQNSIINTGVVVDHHSIIGEHTHVAPGTIICGNVFIGNLCHIGPNSTVIQNITLKDETFIRAHTLVKDNL